MSYLLDKIKYYTANTIESTPLSAAVMLIILKENDEENFEIVLTKRSANLATYAGHYSFPGGMFDARDVDLYQTAIREVQEELNLGPKDYQYIGQLDDFTDREGNKVSVFVTCMAKTDFINKHKISSDEISELYLFPYKKLNQIKDDPSMHNLTRRNPSYVFHESKVYVWGLTASILVHFQNIINKTEKPVTRLSE